MKSENDPWCFLTQFFQLLFGQISIVRTVLKSPEQAISKLTLLFKFGQVEAEILQKNKLPSFFVDTVYISVCGSSND